MQLEGKNIMSDTEKLVNKIFDSEFGLTWEQRFDFLLKAVNDTSKSLNEAAQSSKLLHKALADHNDLLSLIFYLISNQLYDDDCPIMLKKNKNFNEKEKGGI